MPVRTVPHEPWRSDTRARTCHARDPIGVLPRVTRRYRLVGADGRSCASAAPGTLGGHRRLRSTAGSTARAHGDGSPAATTPPTGCSSPTRRPPAPRATGPVRCACPASTTSGRPSRRTDDDERHHDRRAPRPRRRRLGRSRRPPRPRRVRDDRAAAGPRPVPADDRRLRRRGRVPVHDRHGAALVRRGPLPLLRRPAPVARADVADPAVPAARADREPLGRADRRGDLPRAPRRVSSRRARPQASTSPRRSCCATAPPATTACTRTSTAT